MQAIYERCTNIESKIIKEKIDKQGNREEVRASISHANYFQ